MIVYFDTSALVKRYIEEAGTREVNALFEDENAILGSVIITQVEMAAALQKAIHLGSASEALLPEIWQDFLDDWGSFTRIQVSTVTVERASQISFAYKLRGYDALHLAAALLWQERLNLPVTLATFDRDLWLASREAGMSVWPEELAA
ncbi:MAG: type II toxin-antitoxin system VapC family toxin [Anaerolineales bacterium]|nr:type II toxin-antitoxin system VapC family toxin [Anaerolineales bacterium]